MRFWIVIMMLGSLVGCWGQCQKSASQSETTQAGTSSGGASDATQGPPQDVGRRAHNGDRGDGRKAPDAPPDGARETSSTRRLVFFGDSLTSGYGLPDSESYPARIQEMLSQSDSRWEVINAGVAGDTSQGGLERVDWVLRSRPHLVFLCLGANDGLRGIEPARTQDNLMAIVRRIKEQRIPLVMAGMQMPANYGPERNAAYRQVFETVAQTEALPFLPFLIEGVALNPEYNQADGIHPNGRGALLVAQRVFDFLKPHLAQIP